MSTTKQTIAFFGATGGVAGTSLAHALREGYTCTALVRTPEKLHNMLTTQHSIPPTTISSLLTIHTGNIKDSSAVSQALISPLNPSHLVSTIYFGVGGTGKMQASLLTPVTLDDPTICETGMRTILAAIGQLASTSGITTTCTGTKPLIVTISTTGISDKKCDVPFAMAPLYHWGLKVPHEDKKKMEEVLFQDNGLHVRDFVVVRPTLLMDNEPKGLDKVKVGWEWGVKNKGSEGEPGPCVGYGIGRRDVGEWVWRKVVVEGGWEGKCVSLTY